MVYIVKSAKASTESEQSIYLFIFLNLAEDICARVKKKTFGFEISHTCLIIFAEREERNADESAKKES